MLQSACSWQSGVHEALWHQQRGHPSPWYALRYATGSFAKSLLDTKACRALAGHESKRQGLNYDR